ncbi:MAG: hypothetical protein ACYC6M_15945, partial [Terriglobales bacterium]
MRGLTTELLGQASRMFLAVAYPDGLVPPAKARFLDIQPHDPLEPLLTPPICQALTAPDGTVRKYAFRLGSTGFPHLKLQVADCGDDRCVFGVDTHDAISLDPNHPDAPRWAEIQAANRRLKQEIESAW